MPSPAIVRTIVPVISGAILSFLATHNIQIDSTAGEALIYALTVIITGAYYVIVLKLESRWPITGILLGSTARPTYGGRHRKASASPTTATSDSPGDQS